MKKIKISIEGMHCASCVGNVEKAVGKVEGVESVTVSLMTNKAIVEADDSVDEKEIKEVISKLGYKVVS